MYLVGKEIDYLEKELILEKQKNIKLQKEIEEYKEIIKELKTISFKISDDEEGEATSFYDSD
jgi:SMC interacting uncharacterized protein involved in chromosome segregation